LFTLGKRNALKAANITHILSVLNLQPANDAGTDFTRLRIELEDTEEENILQHFKETNAFIEQGIASEGGVFVHWLVQVFQKAFFHCIALFVCVAYRV
jgi:dual specificity phosphatase 12